MTYRSKHLGLFCSLVVLCACGSHSGSGQEDGGIVTDDPDAVRPAPGSCGLADPAFCEDFESGPSLRRGRAGELDRARWSGARLTPLGPTSRGRAFPIGGAQIGACRKGLPSIVLPDSDMLVCDATDDIHSRHALIATAAQNYGQNSVRIRQPFDFSNRTGTIVFDAQGYATLGWISLAITEDPVSIPSYAVYVNDEGGAIPRNAVEVHFNTTCGVGGVPTDVSVSSIHVFDDYADTIVEPMPRCEARVSVRKNALNRFEIRVSESRIEVYATPVSDDGVTFGEKVVLVAQDLTLPFTRGYVHLSTHNHASIKYSTGDWAGNAGETNLDAWVARWDNVGFDGPFLTSVREHELPNAGVASLFEYGEDPIDPNNDHNGTSPAVEIGYVVPDAADSPLVLRFDRIELTGATRARLAFDAWYPSAEKSELETYVLRYRVNGHAQHERLLTAREVGLFVRPTVRFAPSNDLWPNASILGAIGQLIEVPVDELVEGENTIEIVSANIPRGYPPGIVNVDLVVYRD